MAFMNVKLKSPTEFEIRLMPAKELLNIIARGEDLRHIMVGHVTDTQIENEQYDCKMVPVSLDMTIGYITDPKTVIICVLPTLPKNMEGES